jgi:hypothetical protein
MIQEWGRADIAGTWPRPKPVWTLALVLAASLVGIGVGAYQYQYEWTPLQRVFLASYLRSAILSDLGLKTGHYRLLQVVDRTRTRLPLDEELEPVADSEAPFVLTRVGRDLGDVRLVWQVSTYRHADLHAQLRTWIYRDQAFSELLWPSIWWALVVFGCGLIVTIPKDLAVHGAGGTGAG